ncbi:MAG: lipopolysaccharide export LptBFGC system permease protein LptF [Planctomycetota bacterium]
MKLHFHVTRNLLTSFTFGVVAMGFVALPGVAVGAISKLPNTDMIVLLQYLPIVLLSLLPYVLPIGFLLAVVVTFGRLAADNEWTAIQMAGVRPISLFSGPLLFGLLACGTTFWMVGYELPHLKQREKEFVREAVRTAITHLNPGRKTIQIGGFYLRGAKREGDLFLRVYIHKPGLDGADDQRAYADTARIYFKGDNLHVELTGFQPVDTKSGYRANLDKTEVVVPFGDHLKGSKRTYSKARYQTNDQLVSALESGELDEANTRQYVFELHMRYATGAVFFLFLALGASTGLILRRGTQLGAMAVSVTYALLYYVFSMRIGRELGQSGTVHPIVAAWLTQGLAWIGAVILLKKALRR